MSRRAGPAPQPGAHPTLVVVPARDEAKRVGEVIAGVRVHPVDLLVLDDGSTDGTAARAREAGAEVLRWTPNRGKGYALRRGLAEGRERGYRWVVAIDADGEHDPADLPRFLAALAGGHDLVVGERHTYRSGARRALNAFAGFWHRQIDPRITDTNCGYRGFRLAAVEGLDIDEDGFAYEQLFLLEACRRGLRVVFLPVRIHSSQTSGVGVEDVIRTNNAFDRWVLDNADELPLPPAKKALLRVAARTGLLLGGAAERLRRR